MRFVYRKFWNVNLPKTAWILIAAGALLVAIVFMAVSFFGVSHIEDTNGPNNYALCQLTMDDLLADRHSSSSFMSSTMKSGSQTEVSGGLRNYDYTKCTYKAKKFSGVQVLHATKTETDSLKLTIQAQVASGNLEVVILIDGQYYAHVPVNSGQTIVLEDIAGKLVEVKMAGESAAVNISVTRTLLS